ncbi:HNH endonuclease [Candidatus Pacearchaeota archaeon]|nr:HNH endonuclease [Candidatus Pacearchaeota archaeon]
MAEKNNKVAGIVELRSILEDQDYKCALTGDELTPETTAFDHKMPLSQGGSSEKENLHAVIKQANVSKSDMNMQEFIDICAKVIKHSGSEYGYFLKS